MTIGYDAKRAFYNGSGLGSYSRTVLELMSRYYPQVKLVLFVPKKRGKILYEGEGRVVYSRDSFLSDLWRSYGMSKTKEFKELDIFHGLSGELPHGKHKVKMVVTVHDLIFLRFPQFYNPVDVRIYDMKHRYSVKQANLVIAISEATKHDLEDIYGLSGENIRVVYQSYNPIFAREYTREEIEQVKQKYGLPKEYILNVSTIEERKNILAVLEAMEESRIDYPLVIVGRPKKRYFRRVHEFLAKSWVKKNVYFVFNAEFRELPMIYRGSKVFVYPSLYEGFGIPIIEAQVSGVPVITSNVSSMPEAAGQHSILVEPTDRGQIAEAIESLLNDKEKAEYMIEAGREYVKKFSVENFAKGLMGVYEEVLG